MGDPCTVSVFITMLTTGSTSTNPFYLKVGRSDLIQPGIVPALPGIDHGDDHCAGVHAASLLSVWYALHSMAAGFLIERAQIGPGQFEIDLTQLLGQSTAGPALPLRQLPVRSGQFQHELSGICSTFGLPNFNTSLLHDSFS